MMVHFCAFPEETNQLKVFHPNVTHMKFLKNLNMLKPFSHSDVFKDTRALYSKDYKQEANMDLVVVYI